MKLFTATPRARYYDQPDMPAISIKAKSMKDARTSLINHQDMSYAWKIDKGVKI